MSWLTIGEGSLEIMNKVSAGRARTLEVIAAFGLGIEALALVAAAIIYGVYAALGESEVIGFILGIGAFCLLLAAGVGLAARGMWRGRRWARSVGITWQVFQAGLGMAVMSARPAVGVIFITLALLVAGCIMARAGQDDSIPS